MPARYRGWTDLVINGSFWVGAALGAAGSIVLLDPALLDPDIGWRCAFLIGAALGLVIFVMRLWIPESPRWLMTHGRADEAERDRARASRTSSAAAATTCRTSRCRSCACARAATRRCARSCDTLFREQRQRTLVGLSLMAAQAFFYNAIFFTYALVLTDFYGIRADHVGWYLLPFAAGNFLGPVLLGRLFDTLGRRIMIATTYASVGRAAGRRRLSVRDRRLVGDRPDRRLDGDLLLRLGGGKLGLSHGERNLSARSPRARDRVLLCHRHRHRRRRRAVAVRRV